ncbi:MAG: hypothetical protein J1E64_07190 [Acetatifactor sp.]|nr:hypothetical protein [Acetatifactor sp.]
MIYTDEAILKIREQMEQNEKKSHSDEVIKEELEHSIYDEEIKIFHLPVKFTDMELLDGRITMRLPNDFTPRTEEEIARVYFLGNQPQYVYSNPYLDFALALNWTAHQIDKETLFEAARDVEYLLDRVGPQTRFLGKQQLKRDEGNIATFQFVANTLDGVVYMNMFCACVEGRLLMGTLSFDEMLSKRLAPLTEEIVRSLRIREE